jgi:predicted small secreted protein
MRTILTILCFALLSACNTMEGVGRDIQAAGHAITGGAEEGRQKINRQ